MSAPTVASPTLESDAIFASSPRSRGESALHARATGKALKQKELERKTKAQEALNREAKKLSDQELKAFRQQYEGTIPTDEVPMTRKEWEALKEGEYAKEKEKREDEAEDRRRAAHQVKLAVADRDLIWEAESRTYASGRWNEEPKPKFEGFKERARQDKPVSGAVVNHKPRLGGGGGGVRKLRGIDDEDFDEDDLIGPDASGEDDDDEPEERQSTKQLVVPLEELIQPAKPVAKRAGDFEVIAPVRPVVPFDGSNLEAEELGGDDWELLSRREGVDRISYAEAARKNTP